MKSGITAETINNLVVGAGVIYTEKPTASNIDTIVPLGALTGDGTLTVKPIIVDLGDGVNGLPPNSVGFQYVTHFEASYKHKMREVVLGTLQKMIPNAKLTGNKLTFINGIVGAAAYQDLYIFANCTSAETGITGDYIITLKNALNPDGLVLTLKDKNSGEYDINLVANYAVGDLVNAPIEIEKISAEV